MVLEEFNGGHFRETTASSGADPGFCRTPFVLENRRSSQGRGGAHPLHPPPRSAPDPVTLISYHLY